MTLDLDHFRNLLFQATGRALDEMRYVFANEQVYGVSLAVDRLGGDVILYAQSEEGLERTVTNEIENGRWVAKSGDLRSHVRAIYRWDCSTDWHYCDEQFFAADNLLIDSYGCNATTRFVFLCCLATLAKHDVEKAFGQGKQRESVVLNLYVGVQSDEDLVAWASLVNPYEVYTRFATELQHARKASKELEFVGRE